MKSANVFWISVNDGGGRPAFAWKWRSEDNTQESRRSFEYFFNCLTDARRHGYAPYIDGKPVEAKPNL